MQAIPEGWNSPSELPDTDRDVEIMWDDESVSCRWVGFADEISQIPPTGVRVWWVRALTI